VNSYCSIIFYLINIFKFYHDIFIDDKGMPIKRSVFKIGDSRGITLPKSWLELIEDTSGKVVTEIAIEVDSVLTIIPMIDGKLFKLPHLDYYIIEKVENIEMEAEPE